MKKFSNQIHTVALTSLPTSMAAVVLNKSLKMPSLSTDSICCTTPASIAIVELQMLTDKSALNDFVLPAEHSDIIV